MYSYVTYMTLRIKHNDIIGPTRVLLKRTTKKKNEKIIDIPTYLR